MSSNFFVHIVESPSSSDLLEFDLEGNVLCQSLSVSGIDATYLLATDRVTFWEAIGKRFIERIKEDNYKRWPILHISAHGSHDGIALTRSDDFIRWKELTEYFRKINTIMKGALIITFSSCQGSYAAKEAVTAGASPYYALVAPARDVSLSDLAIGFSSFYHVLSKTWNIQKSYDAMKSATLNDAFQLYITKTLREDYKKYLDHILQKMKQKDIQVPDHPGA